MSGIFLSGGDLKSMPGISDMQFFYRHPVSDGTIIEQKYFHVNITFSTVILFKKSDKRKIIVFFFLVFGIFVLSLPLLIKINNSDRVFIHRNK
jgi:hypothetical protein